MLPMIRADVVEQQMDDVLRLLVLPQDWHAEILTSAEAIVYAERRTHTTERISEDTLRDKLQRILEQYEDGFISRDVYREKATDIQRQIHHLHTATESANTAVDMRQFVHLLHDMGTLIESSDAGTKRALIQHLFSHVYLHREAGRGRDKHSVRALTPTEVALPLICRSGCYF
jgi:cysteinyl-tRNA synthetase